MKNLVKHGPAGLVVDGLFQKPHDGIARFKYAVRLAVNSALEILFAGQHFQQSGFSATVAPDKRDFFVFAHGKIDLCEHRHSVVFHRYV